MSSLVVGVLGANVTGGWASQSHLPALRAVDDVRIGAVATTRAESAETAAQALGAEYWYTSAEDLAADPDVELVTVAVRVPAHAAAVTAVVREGKDLYCEWPLATSTAEARVLQELAQAAGIRAVIGLQARLAPAVLAARALVQEGAIGRVLAAQAFSAGMGLGGPVLPADREWAADATQGLSVLTVRTAHTLDALEFIAGPIAALSARVRVATPEPVIAGTDRTVHKTAPDQVLVSGTLASGAEFSGVFLLGVVPPHQPLLTILGADGTLTITADAPDGQVQMNELRVELLTGGAAPRPVPVEPDPAAAGLAEPAAGVARMYAGLRDGVAGLPDFGHAVRLHELLDAITASAQSGAEVVRPGSG